MGYSRTTVVYSGGARTFSHSLSLGFINRDQIRVYILGELDGSGNQIYRAFTWVDDNTITVTNAIAIGRTVVIERTVPKDSLIIDFTNPGSALRPNLDKALKQTLMAVHEVLDGRTPASEGTASLVAAATNAANLANSASSAAMLAAAAAQEYGGAFLIGLPAAVTNEFNTRVTMSYNDALTDTAYTVYVGSQPGDYTNLQTAVDQNYFRSQRQPVIIRLRAADPVMSGLLCVDGDYSGITIMSFGGTPTLGVGFTGVSDTAVPYMGSYGDGMVNHFIVGYNTVMPRLATIIDAQGRCANGYYAFWQSEGHVAPNCGIINVGHDGLSVRGSHVTAYNTRWHGAGNSGVRVAHGSTVNIQSSQFNDCCSAPELGADGIGALDVSRCSVCHARDVTAMRSGAAGANIRRNSVVCLQGSNFSGAAGIGIDAKHASVVSAFSSDLSGCGVRAIECGDLASVDARTCNVFSNVAGAGTFFIVVSEGGRVVSTGSTQQGVAVPPTRINIARYNINYPQGQITDTTAESWHPGVFSVTGLTSGQRYNGTGISDHSRDTASAAQVMRFYNPNGMVGQVSMTGTTTTYSTTSDGRLKVNRRGIGYDPLLWLDAIEVFEADWLSPRTGMLTGDTDILVSAQDIYPLAPEAVLIGDGEFDPGDENFVSWSVDYSKIASPRALAVMQALRAENVALRNEIAAIKAHLNLE